MKKILHTSDASNSGRVSYCNNSDSTITPGYNANPNIVWSSTPTGGNFYGGNLNNVWYVGGGYNWEPGNPFSARCVLALKIK